jgi:hypothetical protein
LDGLFFHRDLADHGFFFRGFDQQNFINVQLEDAAQFAGRKNQLAVVLS